MRPLGRREGPGALQAARDRIGAFAAAVAAHPAQALLLDVLAFRFRADILGRIGSAVRFAERMTAGDQSHGFLVVHGHAAERFADRSGCRQGVGVAARALGIHVDQTHLRGAERMIQRAVGVAPIGRKPLTFRAPVDVFGLPGVDATAGEAERLKAHGLHGDGAGEDHEVGPRDCAPVLLLDRPQQAARLVEVGVVGPAVQRREALQAAIGAAAAVDRAVGAGAVPGHADEERPVVAVVRRPPVLRRRHELDEVGLDRFEVQALECVGVVEVRVVRIRCRVGLAQRIEAQTVGPPVIVVDRFALRGSNVRRHCRREADCGDRRCRDCLFDHPTHSYRVSFVSEHFYGIVAGRY